LWGLHGTLLTGSRPAGPGPRAEGLAVIPAKRSEERTSNPKLEHAAGFPLTRSALAGMTIARRPLAANVG